MRRSTANTKSRTKAIGQALIACAALLLPASATLASGSTASLPAAGNEQPFSVTESFRCTILEVRADNSIRVRDNASGEEHLIQLTADIPLKAQDKKQFEGRKSLEPSDLEEGHRIVVTKRTDTPTVVRIKVLKKKAKA